MSRASKPAAKAAPISEPCLNERARLYPWAVFNQSELQEMTGLPREAISAAFADEEFPAQFGRSRPEDLFAWTRKQPAKMQTKEARI